MKSSLNCLVVFTSVILFSGLCSAKLKPPARFPIDKTFKSKKNVYRFKGDVFPGLNDNFPRVIEFTNENDIQISKIIWISGKLQFNSIDINIKATEDLKLDKPLEAYDRLYSGDREILKEYIFPKNTFHDDERNQLLIIWEDSNKAQFKIDSFLDKHKNKATKAKSQLDIEKKIKDKNLREIKSPADLSAPNLSKAQNRGMTREQYNQQLLQQQQQYYQQMMLMGGAQGFGAQGMGSGAMMNPFAQLGMNSSQINQAQFNPFFQGGQGIDDSKLPYNPFLQQFQPGFQQNIVPNKEAPQNDPERLPIEDKFDRIDRF